MAPRRTIVIGAIHCVEHAAIVRYFVGVTDIVSAGPAEFVVT